MNITDFLHARISEEEAVAAEAITLPAGTERTTPVPQRDGSRFQAYGPNGELMLMQVPASDAPESTPDKIGDWGWSGGPIKWDRADLDQEALRRIFDSEDAPDNPYRITDSGIWDESDTSGASFTRATVPAQAGQGTVRHISLWSPLRALAECAAKRAIIELAEEASGLDASVDLDRAIGPRDFDAEPYVGDVILRHLAAIYATHPDYNPAWRIDK